MSGLTATEAVRRLDKLYEFDREPVSPDRLLGPAQFAGSFAGEHVAATEFVIGVLFVNWGASIKDIFVGLAVGNVLAVLTWTLICAPIAVQTRLTLYWYLRRIGGPLTAVVYNVLNAILFCVLAGCMITVSASAVRIPFAIPAQVHWYPSDLRFVLVVLGVGAVVVTLAILGFKLAAFATVCSPWMFLMFIAGAAVMLPQLAEAAGLARIGGFGQFFEMGRKVVWTGATPDGSPPVGFWKVAAFAWICNLAMHGGLSDMALFRYARRASYGLFSAFGMFLGHYLAWICAGMMGVGAALLLNQELSDLDAGEVGYQALGWSGALAVIIAGWTTSNPTLYRAGLALQAVTPNWSRAKVTLIAGIITTVIACFPFVFTELLNFVGIYGLLLAPAGAIVLTEHWVFPRIGLTRYWASYRGLTLNWPALISWAAGIGFAVVSEPACRALIASSLGRVSSPAAAAATRVFDAIPPIDLFFLFLPVYVLTGLLYIALAPVFGAARACGQAEQTAEGAASLRTSGRQLTKPAPAVNRTFMSAMAWIAAASLMVCLAMAVAVGFTSTMEDYADRHTLFKNWLIAPTIVYFVTGAAYFLQRQKLKDQTTA